MRRTKMAKMNANFLNLKENYLFKEISKQVNAYTSAHPDNKIIKMGIGDVTLPLAPVVTEAMKKAAEEMGHKETFRGYEDSGQGYGFLRDAIKGYYAKRGVALDHDEIFVSDGAKSDSGNINDIFDESNIVLVTDPAYPVYVDSNTMGGKEIRYADSTPENSFAAMPPEYHADLIYLCSPNNPTGSVYTREQLKEWVEYAKKNDAVIIFDAAYEAFITDDSLPRSIFEIEGAESCAIEICSLSKTAGFTGTRCGYTIVPEELMFTAPDGEKYSVRKIWARRQGSKFNGVSYPVQRAAEAVFSEEGIRQCREIIKYYLDNAAIMTKTFEKLNIRFTGGKNSPYIWFECPDNTESWEFFHKLLNQAEIVGTPGSGFGKNGEGWFRMTAFGSRENTVEAMARLEKMLG